MIAILDYGIGNLSSISNMLNKIGARNQITSDSLVIQLADKIILPGVGHFDYCMKQLRAAPFFNLLNTLVFNEKKLILGVCVGCQMLMEYSEEGNEKGLGWIKGKVIRFDSQKMPSEFKIPHMSWSDVSPKNNDSLYKDINEPRFYFVHSYHVVCDLEDQVSATAEYGYEFTASVRSDNIRGVQFHPEKSHLYGMKLYGNFVKLIN